MKVLPIMLALLYLGHGAAAAPFDPAPLAPAVAPSREVILAGGGTAHFACETAAANQRSYQGLIVLMHELLDGWDLSLAGESLDPALAAGARVWPDALERRYPDGTREDVFLPRETEGLLLTVRAGRAGRLDLAPRVDFRHIWEVPRPAYRAAWNERLGALFVSREGWEPPDGVPRVLCVLPDGAASWWEEGRFATTDYPRDAARRAMERTHPWIPGRLELDADPAWPLRVAFGLGADDRAAHDVARGLLDGEASLRDRSRLHRRQLAGTVPRTGIARVDTALVWARWSLDNLTMNARGPGIYAGYHWFTTYWGRDTFISLPGACLVAGDFARARDILASFAGHQLVDPADPRQGRLPNIVDPVNLQYAGVDGTWWWVRAAGRYLDATGDRGFLALARPVVERAVAGALAHAADEAGLLAHGDGETWMDAGGEANPFSPRGDRAVEVQVLWWDGLRTAARLAGWDGDPAAAARHRRRADRARDAIRQRFPRGDGLGLADHLNRDASRDLQVRPNQLFALTLPRRDGAADGPDEWWGADLAREILDTTARRCVLPHGVTSLDPADPAWVGRHLDWDDHFFDAAYHNGDVWLWLSGPVIQALCEAGRADEAWQAAQPLLDDLMDHGCVGSLREIRDGEARRLEDYGGATSQAWSLAELLRVFHEAFLGLHPRAMEREVLWIPRPPAALTRLAGRVRLGDRDWQVALDGDRAVWSPLPALSSAAPERETWTVTLLRPDGASETRRLDADAREPLNWKWR